MHNQTEFHLQNRHKIQYKCLKKKSEIFAINYSLLNLRKRRKKILNQKKAKQHTHIHTHNRDTFTFVYVFCIIQRERK